MKIITDSTCDLTPEMLRAFGVDEVIPMKILVGGKEYMDKVNITNEEFYRVLPTLTELPKTTQCTAQEFGEVYARYPDEELIVMPISSGLSGSYGSALMAAGMSGRDNIYVVDDKATALALGLMVQVACQRRDEGKTAKEIYDELTEMSGHVRVYAVVETLKFLVMGGRMSRAAGLVGSALNIKPLICLKDGVLTSPGKARGTKAAVKLMRQLVDSNEEIDTRYPFYFAHAYNDEGMQMVKETFPEYVANAPTLTVGCIVGTHTGAKITAVGFVSRK